MILEGVLGIYRGTFVVCFGKVVQYGPYRAFMAEFESNLSNQLFLLDILSIMNDLVTVFEDSAVTT
jgi:hypothetical protein